MTEAPWVGGQRLGPHVVLHGLLQVMLLGAEAQLSAGLVDLEGVAHSDVPHLASSKIYGPGLAEGYLVPQVVLKTLINSIDRFLDCPFAGSKSFTF